MKKKRSGKKKSQNSKANNNGTNAEVTIEVDKHHNWSRPCSALAASISKEIFPSLPSSNNDTTDDTSTGKLLLTQQPLFAFMILRHMIEERKKIRATVEKEGNTVEVSGEMIPAIRRELDQTKESVAKSTSLTPYAISQIYSMNGSGDQPSFTPIVQIIHVKKLDTKGVERFKLILSDGQYFFSGICGTQLNHLVHNGIISEHCILRITEFIVTIASSGAKLFIVLAAEQVSSNVVQNNPGYRIGTPVDIKNISISAEVKSSVSEELNTLLDSYVDSTEACDVLDNEAKRWGERDIESFVTHLTQKFDCHVKKAQQKKSDKQNALQELNTDALALKDILPTISINDASAHISFINQPLFLLLFLL